METILERLEERASITGRVDRENGVIRGVKLLGLESANGRSYSPAAVKAAAKLYERCKCNVNHARNASGPRGYEERLGSVKNVKFVEGSGLYGDLHYNPRHALAKQLEWDAENHPENVGLSHSIDGRTTKRDGRVVVEEIVKVYSVDLVADPATVAGLYESRDQPAAEPIVEESLYRNPTPEETTEFVRDVCR